MKYDFLYGKSAFCLPGSALDYVTKASQNDLRVLLALGSGKFADEKALAAFRKGIKDIIIPIANQKDIAEIPKEIKKEINFITASNVEQVFDRAIKF